MADEQIDRSTTVTETEDGTVVDTQYLRSGPSRVRVLSNQNARPPEPEE